MIWVILILGLILRLINLNQSLWLDEAINVLAVKNNSLIDLITKYAAFDFHPPGYFIILWGWTKLFGISEIAVRVPSVIFGVLTIGLIYLIGKINSKKLALFAALLMAINPLHIYYSQEARMYSFACFAVALNIFILIKNPKLILLIFSNILVLSSDYLAYFIFSAQIVYLVLNNKPLIKKWLLALIIAIASGFWWIPVFLEQIKIGSQAAENLPSWKETVGAFDFKEIPLTFVKFIIGRIGLDDKVAYYSLLAPLAILYGFLLFKARSNKLFLSWLFIPIILATVASLFLPVYSYFRLLFILPAFILLITLGILSFKKYQFFLTIVVMVSIFCSFVYLFNPKFHREDWKGLTNYYNQKSGQLILESSGLFAPLEYYNSNAVGALKNFPAKDVSDVVEFNKPEIYLVEYLVDISDSGRLVSKKLDSLGYKLLETKNFNGVGFVYHYVK